MTSLTGSTGSSGVREAPMHFGSQPKLGRCISVGLGERAKKNDKRPWEQPKLERALLYVRRQAMEVST